MRLPLRVIYEDDTEVKIEARSLDFLAFEKHYDRPATDVSRGYRMEWWWFLAHHALVRTGVTDQDFDAWAATVEDVGADNTDDEVEADADPLDEGQAPSTG